MMPVERAMRLKRFLLLMTLGMLSSCGFHLRESSRVELAPALSTLRVMVKNSQQQYDPLLVEMENALRAQTNVEIVETGDAPLLVLYGEKSDRQVLSVNSTAKVNQYLLKYEVSFRLTGKEGKSLSEPQTVRTQRYYDFDPLNVLPSERQEKELWSEMQRDVVQQILRRVSRKSALIS
jgi:LPS-assembly lipoprotein